MLVEKVEDGKSKYMTVAGACIEPAGFLTRLWGVSEACSLYDR